MSFLPLDRDILDSTVWRLDAVTCKVWITMLAMADYRTGICRATAPGIAARASLDLEGTRKALATLSSPDEDSRSKTLEGRRIQSVEGGYLIVNFALYSKGDDGAAVRMRNMRARKSAGMDKLLDDQGHRCACCTKRFEEPYSLYVVQDHCHATGKNRALLCQSCNKIVGLIEHGKDCHSQYANLAVAYVESWSALLRNETEVVTELRNASTSTSTSASASPSGPKKTRAEPEGFEKWYSPYPWKSKKADAIKAWLQLNPGATLQATMFAAVVRQNRERATTIGFYPNACLPASWIRGERWNDTAPPVEKPKGAPVVSGGRKIETEPEYQRRIRVNDDPEMTRLREEGARLMAERHRREQLGPAGREREDREKREALKPKPEPPSPEEFK